MLQTDRVNYYKHVNYNPAITFLFFTFLFFIGSIFRKDFFWLSIISLVGLNFIGISKEEKLQVIFIDIIFLLLLLKVIINKN